MDDGILDPEDRLLLSATAPMSFPTEQSLSPSERRSLSWDRMFQLARSNRVAGFLGDLLEHGALSVPADSSVRSHWRRLRGALAIQNELARRQLQALAEELRGAGIRTLLYKGLDFQFRFYSGEILRSFNDVDLIVAADDARRADAVFRSAGYDFREGDLPLDYYLRFHLHAVYRHPDWRYPIELHWALDSPYVGPETRLPELFAAAQPAPHLSGFLSPSPIDALALMVLHLAKHLGLCARLPTREARLKSVLEAGGLVWLVDVIGWFRTQGELHSSDLVLERMRTLEAESSLAVAARLVLDLDPQSVPSELESFASPSAPGRSLLATLVYPDLCSARGVTRFGPRVRAVLMRTLPGLTFRPIAALEIFFPGVAPRGRARAGRMGRLLRVLLLASANLLALARWKLRSLARAGQANPSDQRQQGPRSLR